MKHKPKMLDAFCCQGGCTKGYQRTGFHVTGIDINPQPRYCGDEFVQGDAIEYILRYGHLYDAIASSPPCQGYSRMRHVTGKGYPMLIEDVRAALRTTGKPYIIENVEGAPLDGITLCGTMFGLKTFRHRIFETSFFMLAPQHITHTLYGKGAPQGRPVTAEREYLCVTGHFSGIEAGKRAMGIDWMTKDGLTQAIPPAYTEYIGRHLMEVLS